MVMAFDRDGKQVPEYQDHGRVIIPKLHRDFSGLVVEGMDWAADFQNKPELWLAIPNSFGMDWRGQSTGRRSWENVSSACPGALRRRSMQAKGENINEMHTTTCSLQLNDPGSVGGPREAVVSVN
jgi:hypothetical protein